MTTQLLPPAFRPLPLGAIRPAGWLHGQLRIQADGLGGHLGEVWPDVGDSAWIGGSAEGWERGPYWLDGFVPLAFLLGDQQLINTARRWVDAILERQRDDGWLGPIHDITDSRRKAFDAWPVFVALKALAQYHEATGDPRIIPAMLRFLRLLERQLKTQPLFDWGRYRWPDLVITLHWLYERTAEPWLLDLAAKAHEQGFDWQAHFAAFPYLEKSRLEQIFPSEPLPGCTFRLDMASHVVNNAMALKQPGVWFRQSGAAGDREAARQMIAILDQYHGQATGMFTGDEHLAGLNPSQGTELCAVVEYMFSLEVLLASLGDPLLADRLESITYNALPATFTPDMWAHQYDQQANQVICAVTEERLYTNNRADANIFGLEPDYGCCTANMHQGWPKFASHLWMTTPEGGLAAVTYAPCVVETSVAGNPVRITVETEYPFDEVVRIVVEPAGATSFPLRLRVPAWASGATLVVDGGATEDLLPGTFHTLERAWNAPVTLELRFPMQPVVERRFQGAVAIKRGPLVYGLKIGEEWRQLRELAAQPSTIVYAEPGPGDWEVLPATPWNYALALDPENLATSIHFTRRPLGDRPFSPDGAPIEATVHGRKVPDWTISRGAAEPPPASPIHSSEPLEELTLLPYGCTNLRITEFPTLE